jgi:flavin-dependent dehydrogenase
VLLHSGILKRQPRAILAARAYFEEVDPLRPYLQLRFDHVPLPGYGWVFPVGPRLANVGVGFIPGRRRPRLARTAFDAFVQPLLRGARQSGPLKGYPIRADFLSSPTSAERTLLVGEAAGLVNPLTGEGIDYALESGALAAQHIVRESSVVDYDAALRGRFEKLFRFSTVVRDWYCLPPVLNALIPLANSRPALRQLLTDTVLGEREPAGYNPLRMFGCLLLYVARTRRKP